MKLAAYMALIGAASADMREIGNGCIDKLNQCESYAMDNAKHHLHDPDHRA